MKINGITKNVSITLLAIIYCLISLTTDAFARVVPIAFKGITQHFRPGCEMYSPTVGRITLETGLIYNMRFYGPFKSSYKPISTGSRREYIKDNSKDPLWSLLKHLFPSPSGTLSVETGAGDNFGRHVFEPNTVALLLAYAYQVRKQYHGDEKNKVVRSVEDTEGREEGEGEKEPALLSKRKQTIPYKDFERYVNEGVMKAEGGQENIGISKNARGRHITLSKEQWDIHLRESFFERLINEYKDLIFKTLKLYNGEASHKTNIRKLKNTIQGILQLIKKAISEEKESFYPSYTTEQVILAFFCEKFNTQGDIWQLLQELKALAPDMIKDGEISEEDNLLSSKDIVEIAQKDKWDLDDFYAMANRDLFARIVPYKNGEKPLSNANAHVYDRRNNEKIASDYPDCVEMMIRHMSNLITFDPSISNFNLSKLVEYVKRTEPTNPYFGNFVNFYATQSPINANSGEPERRFLWGTVVGDLNVDHQSDRHEIPIRYVQQMPHTPHYELRSGFINLVNVLRKLFSLQLENTPVQGLEEHQKDKGYDLYEASFEQQKILVKEYLTSYFNAVNPDRYYEIKEETSLFKGKYGESPDIYGDLRVVVYSLIEGCFDPGIDKEECKDEELFSFTLSVVEGHSEINTISYKQLGAGQSYKGELERRLSAVTPGNPIYNILELFSVSQSGDENPQVHPLYYLFSTLIQDNVSRIKALNRILTWRIQNGTSLVFYENALVHLLENISWRDDQTLRLVTPLLLRMQPYYPKILQEGVRGIHIPNSISQKDLGNVLEYFPYLEHLKILNARKINYLAFSKMPLLKTLVISGTSLKKITGLNHLGQLTMMNLHQNKKLESIGDLDDELFPDMPNLTWLNLAETNLSEINGIEKFTGLEFLNLSEIPHLKSVSFKKLMPRLKELFISNSDIVELNGLEYLEAVEDLYLYNLKNMDVLSLPILPHLKTLNVMDSGIEKEGQWTPIKIKGLANNPGLRVDGIFKNLDN